MAGNIVNNMGILEFIYSSIVMTTPSVTITDLKPGPDSKIKASEGDVFFGVQTLTIPSGWTTTTPPPGATGVGTTTAPTIVSFNPTTNKVKNKTGFIWTDDIVAQGVANGTAPGPTPPGNPIPFAASFSIRISKAGQNKVTAQ